MNSRKRKNICGVTDFLQKSGLLENGTKEEITKAKKMYWVAKRKEWQIQKRKECKSYTVFFAPSEYKDLISTLKGPKMSVTAFIKQSALQIARNSRGVDKITAGQIREAFFETYNLIEAIGVTTKEEQLIEVLARFVNMEQKVLNLLQ